MPPHHQAISDLFSVLIEAQGSLNNFWAMILLKTGKRAEVSYAFYGCHCGLGGKGSPKDATDR
jgi:secretory phospholipase A2